MAEPPVTTQATPLGTVRQIAVPSHVRALSTLARIDYADTFIVDVGRASERTAEQWARAVVEDAPARVRLTLQSGWSALGLKLGEAPPDRSLLGWEIRRSTPELVLLGADSRVGMPGELLFKRRKRTLLYATFLQQDNPIARAMWAGVEPAHGPIVRRILERAARRQS